MPLILPRRSLLAYPAGRAPGFDPTHPIAKGVRFSGVASPSGFVDLRTGRPGAITGAPTFSLKSGTGPHISFATGDTVKFSGTSPDNDPSATCAAIVQVPFITGFQSIFSTSNINDGWRFYTGSGGLSVVAGGIAAQGSFAVTTANVPQLLLISVSPSVCNFLVVDLTTGAFQSDVQAGIASVGAPSSPTYWVGNNVFDQFFPGIASVAYFSRFMPMSEMMQFARDPWSFWYPPAPPAQRKVSYSYSYGPAADTTGGARVLQRFNRSKLAYPAGSLPGFDPTHPGSKNIRFSSVFAGATHRDLLNAKRGTQVGTLTPVLDGRIGPAGQMGNVADTLSFSGYPTLTPTHVVLSAIVVPSSNDLAATFALLGTDGDPASGAGNYLLLGFGGGVYLSPSATGGGSRTGFFPSPALVAGVPYFICWVSSLNFCIITNLQTGAVQAGYGNGYADNSPVTMGSSGSSCGFGYSSGAAAFTGSVAAFSISYQPFSIPQARAWAADPWSFWYPNKMLNLTDGGTPVVPVVPSVTTLYQLINVG